MQEKGKLPSQTQPNPRGVHELSSSNGPNPGIDEVKVVITLRNGKKVKHPILELAEEGQEAKETEPVEEVTKGNAVKNSTPYLFHRH